ncbi:MAG: alpha/beta hydrolase fold domain-containing protein [Rhizomicrobium sp.]
MLLFPVTQIGRETSSLREFAIGYFLDKPTLDWFFGNYIPAGTDMNDTRVSPLNAADFKGLPPAYVMLGGCDPLHDEGLAYAKKLQGSRCEGRDRRLRRPRALLHLYAGGFATGRRCGDGGGQSCACGS